MPGTLDDFLTARRSVLVPMTSLTAMYFVYGLYVALFIAYIQITRRRRQRTPTSTRRTYSQYFVPIVLLFVFSTFLVVGQTIYRSMAAYLAFTAAKTKHYRPLVDYLQHDVRKTLGFALNDLCSVFINTTADYILVHRCYTIWGLRKRIAIPLILASVATNVVGLVGGIMEPLGLRNTTTEKNRALAHRGNSLAGVFLLMSVVVNMIVTLLTAGRIWWIYHQSREYGSDKLYKRVFRIIVESGFMYPLISLIQYITVNYVSLRSLPFEFSSISYLTAGIASTLIMVRVRLGKTVEHTTGNSMDAPQPTLSDVRFTSCPPASDGMSHDDDKDGIPMRPIRLSLNMAQAQKQASGSEVWKDSGEVQEV